MPGRGGGGAARPAGGRAETGDEGHSLAGLRERSLMFPAALEDEGARGVAERGAGARARGAAATGGGGGAAGAAAAAAAASRTKLQ